MDLIEVAMYVS